MKFKYLIIIALVSLFTIKSSYGQKDKYEKIKLGKSELAQDSAIATWGVIVSTPSFAKESKKLQFEEFAVKGVVVSLSPDEKKGLIYVDFQNLPDDTQPILSLSDENGKVITQQKAKFANNAVNMRKLPPGTYLFTVNVDKEISTWEFIKE